MKLSLRQLQAFLAIADAGSTALAAEQVALSQSATSAALNELEHLLEIQLFDRVGKRLLLNDNGRMLIPQARLMLDTAATIESQFKTGTASLASLRLGASSTIGNYCLPHLFAAHTALSGQQLVQDRVQPQLSIANTADIVELVANYSVDFGFIEGPCRHADLVVEPWLEDEMMIVCHPEHPLLRNGADVVSMEALQDEYWLLRERGSGTREIVEQKLQPHLHRLRIAGEIGNSEAIKHAAAAGLGLACLSRMVVADWLETGKLVELKTTLPEMRRFFYIVYHRHKLLSPQIQRMLDFCRRWRWQ